MWVIVAGCLVMFMQAGFALPGDRLLEGKNAGTVIAKILTNFSIAALGWWAVGFALAFGGRGQRRSGTTEGSSSPTSARYAATGRG